MKKTPLNLSKILPIVDPESLSDEDSDLVARLLSYIEQTGNVGLLEDIFSYDYEETPVPPAEFLSSKFYLGPFVDSIYPTWRSELEFVLDPENGINEWILYGSIGTGKCLVKSTLVNTLSGLLTLEEICTSDINSPVQTESGYKDLVHKHDEGRTETRKIQTRAGRSIEGRPNHRVRVLGADFSSSWKSLGDLAPGDVLVVAPMCPRIEEEDLSDASAELIGWIVAEGCRNQYGVVISVHPSEKQHILCLAKEAQEELSLRHIGDRDHEGTVYLGVADGSALCPGDNSHSREIPFIIRSSGARTWRKFLRGLFSGDGTVDRRGGNAPVLTTTSNELANQVQTMLTALGINSTLRQYSARISGKEISDAWDIRILGLSSRQKFSEEIGFWNETKQQLLEAGLLSNSNSDHKAGFRINGELLRGLQPKGKCGNSQKGPVPKARTPRGLCHRLQSQRATASLLQEILRAGGTLPHVLERVANEELFLDEVKTVSVSTGYCYDLTMKNDPSYISNGFISHNTSVASVAQLYKLYWLTCMKCPQKLFGLAEQFPVYFAFFSVTKGKAEDAINAKFQSMMNMSPYFREKLPKNPRKVFLQGAASMFGAGYREHPKKDDLFELVLPHNLHLLFGSQTNHALSLDVFSATLDEMNFRSKKSIRDDQDENSAQALYHQVRTRIESRFQNAGFNPGLVVNISSARSSDSFVEQRIKEVREKGLKNVHISDFALWDVKPGRYGTKRFHVFVGSGFRSSRILAPGETVLGMKEGETIIEVPEVFRDSFETSLDASIRDLAGVATASINKLFKRREIIQEANGQYTNPILPETLLIGLNNGLEISDFFDVDAVSRYDNIDRHLLFHPLAGRFIHVDLAKVADRVGITSLCIPFYYKKILTHTDDSKAEVALQLPFIFVDFHTRIMAPKMDEISFEKIKSFIVWLKDSMRYPIVRVSYDSWQSIHSMQLLKVNGIETETISVDKTDEPYMELMNAFIDHRIMKPPFAALDEELRTLEHDIRAAKGAVDHPPNGSKDIADSLAGAYANALEWTRKHGFGAVGAYLIQEAALTGMFAKHPKELRAEKISKELGYDEPVRHDTAYDGRFYGTSRTARG